ncbi:ABC transporter substrate-binding protein [Catenovulum sp. 2E275]|uniref:MlaC/ttg2D family ABC transporter substrate-binding protein n=1 Tax=Catenovulum sp. 2E275 TaxID=2980497 RepID=UPI0021CFD180|nr:ABC transporter substrate-binding protein [Catenovulum sp. 2E275]MCU4675470.1 ABC transporter substrate-binding protein [Catenovulum sp. 2E275]
MKKIVKACLLTFSLISAPITVSFSSHAASVEQTEQDPYILFDKVTQKAFARFKKEWPQVQQNPELLKQIIREELMPYVDYEYAAFKVLGKYVREINSADRQAFVDTFKDYIVTVYAQLFTQYRDTQNIEVEKSNSLSGDKIVVVKTRIVEPGRPDISVIFKLIYRSDKWGAFDMEAEGISMLNTKRKEIGSAIDRVGIKGIIADLRDKADQKLKLNATESNND